MEKVLTLRTIPFKGSSTDRKAVLNVLMGFLTSSENVIRDVSRTKLGFPQRDSTCRATTAVPRLAPYKPIANAVKLPTYTKKKLHKNAS